MGNLRLNGRTIAIGVLVILVLIVVGSQLLGGQGNNADQGQNNGDNFSASPTLASSGVETSGVSLGRVVTAAGTDGDGCPVNLTDQFAANSEIYVVIEDSDIPAGTTVFARLFREGSPIEDADMITADQDYDNTCIYFVFDATETSQLLDPGFYEAQVIVNGNPGERVGFEVR